MAKLSTPRLPDYDAVKRDFQRRFHAAVASGSLPEFHATCRSCLDETPDAAELPYAFAYAARALMHDPRMWHPDGSVGLPCMLAGLDGLLAHPAAINCRDNYYYAVVAGLRHFIAGDHRKAYAALAGAARFGDFSRVVKDDFGGGASFARTFPDSAALAAARRRLTGQPAFLCRGTDAPRLAYSISFDPVYAEAFAGAWVEAVSRLSRRDLGLHFHVVFRAQADAAILERLLALARGLEGRFWLSTEVTGGSFDRAYFASARFLHAVSFLEAIAAPLWIVDADALPVHTAEDALELASRSERVLGLLYRGHHYAYLPWRAFAASWLFAPATEAGRGFLTLVADCIRYLWDDRPGRNWWIDQFALKTAAILANEDSPNLSPAPLGRWGTAFRTGEEFKVATLSRHPEIAAMMATGVSFHQALRQVASRY